MPMGKYNSFEDCVAANKDKSDPSAYCGSIKHKVEDKKMLDGLFYKTGSIEVIKSADGQPETWRAVLSSTNVDLDGERMSRKALDMAAQDLMKNSTVFFNHKHHELPIGKFTNTAVIDKPDGSYLVVDIQPSLAKGVEDVVTQVREGVLKCMSIGGKTLKSFNEVSKSADGREESVKVLDEIKALEGSIVGIGANQDAMMISVAKSLFIDAFTKDHIPGHGMHDEDSKAAYEYVDEYRHEGKSPGSRKEDMSGGTGVSPVVPKVEEKHEPDKGKKKVKKDFDGEGDSMSLVTCPSCQKEFSVELEKGHEMKKPPKQDEEEEEEKEEEKKKDADVDVAKENGPSTPNDHEIGSKPNANASTGLKPKVKKPAVPEQSGALDGELGIPSKSVADENVELKKQITDMAKDMALIKDVIYKRKSAIDATEGAPKTGGKYELMKSDIFKAMGIEE